MPSEADNAVVREGIIASNENILGEARQSIFHFFEK